MAEKIRPAGNEPLMLVSEKANTGQSSPHEHAAEDTKIEPRAAAADASGTSDEPARISSSLADDTSPTSQETMPSSPPSPPNGGARAWLQVLGSFCLYFNTWGELSELLCYRNIS